MVGIFSLIYHIGSDTPLLTPHHSLVSLDTIKNRHTTMGWRGTYLCVGLAVSASVYISSASCT